jgi:hypothetical protein
MEQFIYQCPGSLSREMCNDAMNLFEELKEHHYQGVTGGKYKTGINTSIKDATDLNVLDFFPTTEKGKYIVDTLFQELHKHIQKYYDYLDPNNDIFKIDIVHKNKIFETFLYHKYTKNKGKFSYHNDFYVDEASHKYRILNYMWYINDITEGGETEFFGSYQIKPEAGKIVIFPSEWMFPHCGKTPVSNDKHIITGWIYIHI